MKHIIALSAAFALCSALSESSFGQITITQSDMPAPGTIVYSANDTSGASSPGPAGASQSWNFSTLLTHTADTLLYYPSANTPYENDFPGSNLAITDSTSYQYYRNDSSAFSDKGFHTIAGALGAVNAAFNPPQKFITYPSTYNTAFSDSSNYVILAPYSPPPPDSVRFVARIIYSSIIDGWGTLTTPSGTFSTVRQKYITKEIDSIFIKFFGGWQFYQEQISNDTIFRWFANNKKYPVLTMTKRESNPKWVAKYQTINASCSLSVSVATTNQTLPSLNNGTATATASGGTTPYFYQWNTGATTAGITGLAPGTYSVNASDSAGCVAVGFAVIQAYPCSVLATTSATAETSVGANNGTATVTASGGSTPYSYSWSNSKTTQTITGLAPAIYYVTVTDSIGCKAMVQAKVDSFLCTLSASVSKTDETSAGGNNGTATVTASGGKTPYSYSWSNGKTTSNITGLTPGTYFVTVTDSSGCKATGQATVNAFVCTLSASVTKTNETQSGANNGTATVTASGGTSPYSYSWSNGKTTSNITGLSPGTYSVTVTDNKNCKAYDTDTILAGPSGFAETSSQNHFMLYPVPASNEFMVSVSYAAELELKDITGKTVQRFVVSGNTSVLNISHLPPGIYFYLLKDSKGNLTNKGKISVVR